jgi:CubicO group peptidase (beta-lactamase class C family)
MTAILFGAARPVQARYWGWGVSLLVHAAIIGWLVQAHGDGVQVVKPCDHQSRSRKPSIRCLAGAWLLLVAGAAHAASDLDTLASALGKRFIDNPSHVGLSIGITDRGERKSFYFGSVERDRSVAPNAGTIYELASLTKSYTGMLLARAVLDRKLALDDDVRPYLPRACRNLVFRGHPIRIVDLANHTSGLPKNVPPFIANASPGQLLAQYGEMSRETFLRAVAGVRLTQRPGTRFAYSNAGVQLLGIVLERVYGMRYDALVARFIAAPHQMQDTTTVVAAQDQARYAKRYDGKGNAMPELSFWRHVPAAGFLKSTIADQLRYLEWNLDESDPVVALAHRVTFRHTAERGDDIGLSWFLNRQHGKRLVRHAGGSFGSTTFELLYPEAKVGVVLLANDTDASTEATLSDMADQLAEAAVDAGNPTD